MSNDKIRLLICHSCAGTRDPAAERLAVQNALVKDGLADRVEVGQHSCFSGCEDPVSISLQGLNLASYVFSGLNPISDADDISVTCRAYLDSPAGWIEDARSCGRLRLCLRARIPAFQST